MARARAAERRDAGVGASDVADAVTPNWFVRSVKREEGLADRAGWLVFTLAVCVVLGAAVGPAMLLGWAVYGAWVWRAPQARTAPDPFLLAVTAVILLVGATATVALAPPQDMVLGIWWRVQPGLGLGYSAWLVRAWGWAAVEAVAEEPGTVCIPVGQGASGQAPASKDSEAEPAIAISIEELEKGSDRDVSVD